MSYWDFLPNEIQEIIYGYRDTIIAEERKEFIRGLSMEEMFLEIASRMGEKKDININKDYNIYHFKKYDLGDILDAINLGINMNRSSSINTNETNQTVIHFDTLSYEEQLESAVFCYDKIPLDVFITTFGINDGFYNLADICFRELSIRWHYY